MRAHIIENGKVANTIEVESLDFMPGLVNAELGGKIGDEYDGETFTTPQAVVEVPKEVTRRQARQALLLAGKLDLVEPAIAAIPDPTIRALALIEWQDSLKFERDRPLVNTLGAALGLTSGEIDQLFITASTL